MRAVQQAGFPVLVSILIGLAGCAPTQTGGGEMFGTLAGAVTGGLIGAQFGSGTGQLVTTATGTLAGAAVGNYLGAQHDRGAFAGGSGSRPVSNINNAGMPAYAPSMGAYAVSSNVSSAYRQNQNFVPMVAYGQAYGQNYGMMPTYQVVQNGMAPAPYGCTYVAADGGHLVRYCADPYAGWYAAPK
jgi:hypothetical protein